MRFLLSEYSTLEIGDRKRNNERERLPPSLYLYGFTVLEALSFTASVKSRLVPRAVELPSCLSLDTPQSRSGAHLARPHHEHADAHALVVQLGRFRQRACDLLQIL